MTPDEIKDGVKKLEAAIDNMTAERRIGDLAEIQVTAMMLELSRHEEISPTEKSKIASKGFAHYKNCIAIELLSKLLETYTELNRSIPMHLIVATMLKVALETGKKNEDEFLAAMEPLK